jgi:hypothetical protein
MAWAHLRHRATLVALGAILPHRQLSLDVKGSLDSCETPFRRLFSPHTGLKRFVFDYYTQLADGGAGSLGGR